MKILLITDESGGPGIHGGGLGYLMSILRPAKKLGHEIKYITADSCKISNYSLESKIEVFKQFKSLAEDFKPDIIGAFNFCIWGSDLLELSDILKIPVVLHVPDYMLVCKNRMLFRTDLDNLCEYDFKSCHNCNNNCIGITSRKELFERTKNRKIVAISEFLKKAFIAGGYDDKNISVIKLGLNIDYYKPNYGGDTNEILNICRISREKGLDYYNKISYESGKLCSELKFILAGYPPTAFDGINFEYLGTVSERDKLYLLKRCEIFLSTPIWYEPAGFTYLEAKASGKPVMAFGYGGIEDYHKTDSSKLYKKEQTEILINDLINLHCNEEERIRMGKKGRKEIEENHDENKQIKDIIDIYEREAQ